MDKLQIMLELERRGALPSEKQAILTELRSRGAIPAVGAGPDVDNPQDAHGLSANTRRLVQQSMNWLSPDIAKTAEPGTPAATGDLPSFAGQRKIGQPESTLTPVPAWKQAAMGVVNKLPEVGQAVGTAAGMASALAPGAQPAAPLAVLGGAAAGKVAGRTLQTPFTQLLLPEVGARVIGPSEVARTGLQGAESGALDALLMRMAPILGQTQPGAALEAGVNPAETTSARARDYLTKRLLLPARGNPEETKSVIQNVGKKMVDIAHERGPQQIQNQIRDWSGAVDELIANAEASGKTISKTQLMQPLQNLGQQFAKGDLPKYSRAINTYMKGFNQMHPEEELTPTAAQELKKFIYQTIDKGWGEATYNPATEAKKTLSGALKGGLEEAAGPKLEAANTELGKLIEMRPYVTKATERIQEEPIYKRGLAHGKQALRDIAAKSAAKIEARPEIEPRSFATIGSPIQNLEEMFGVKYGAPLNVETRPERLLPAPAGAGGPTQGGRASFTPSTGTPVEGEIPTPMYNAYYPGEAEQWSNQLSDLLQGTELEKLLRMKPPIGGQ
jgi:hypothetical protein